MSGETAGEGAGMENALQLVQELFGDDNEELKDEHIDEGQAQSEEEQDDQEHLFADDGQQEDQDIDEEEEEDEGDEDEDNQEESDEGQRETEKAGAAQIKGKEVAKKEEDQEKKGLDEKSKIIESDDDEDEIVLKTVVPKVKATETVVPAKKKSFRKSKSPHESKKPKSNNNKRSSQRKSRSRSRSKSNSKDRLFCCTRCKKNDKGGRTCICLVPAKDRRISIDQSGCQPCGCKGCSKGKPLPKKERSRSPVEQFEMKNGCCRQCLKAFSKTGKACLCQVPEKVRKTELGRNGCKYCGCKGCNPEDTRSAPTFESREEKRKGYSRERGGQGSAIGGAGVSSRQPDNSSNSNNRSRPRSYSRERPASSARRDEPNSEFPDNAIKDILQNDLHVYPPLVGFFVPHRSYSYITGKSNETSSNNHML